MLLRLKGGNIATLLIGPSTPFVTRHRQAVTLSAFQLGDRLVADARPDPQRALTYGAGTIRDMDLVQIGPARGLVIEPGENGSPMTMQFRNTTVLVDINGRTRIEQADGRKIGPSSLDTGDTVVVNGIYNTRLKEITTTDSIRLLSAPRIKGTPKPR
jgi:hypothetical protein